MSEGARAHARACAHMCARTDTERVGSHFRRIACVACSTRSHCARNDVQWIDTRPEALTAALGNPLACEVCKQTLQGPCSLARMHVHASANTAAHAFASGCARVWMGPCVYGPRSRGRDCLAAAASHVRVLMRLLTRDSCARIQCPRQWARATPCAHRQLSCARALCARVAGSAAASPPASRLSPDGRGLPALCPRARVGSGSLPACLVLQNRAWSMGECACAGRAGCACERTPRGARRAC